MARQKGKRWKRGDSCVSNPTSKKHRADAANVVRSKRQKVENNPKQGLGVALKNLESSSGLSGDGDDVTHITALSNWTVASEAAGSLPSFDSVRKLWNSPLESHKEVCAVLTAVTEVIKSEGEEESPTAYFAALLTALESATIVERQTAIAYLLGLVIPNVSQSLLRLKFAPSSKLLFSVLESQSNKDMSVALTRSLFTCISHLFLEQDPAIWGEMSVLRMLEFLVGFVFHSKPKIRHAAQRALTQLSRRVAAVCSVVLRYCTQQLDRYTGSKEEQVTLHTISFIRYILPHCTEQELREGIESLLRVITLRHTKVTSAALQALTSFFKQQSCLSGQMQGQIIMNLFTNKPATLDHPITTVWLEALSSGYSNLATLEPKLGVIMAPTLFSVCSECVISKNSDVVQTTLVAMEMFCAENIQPALGFYEKEIAEQKEFPLSKVVEVLKDMLRLTYQSVWDVVLQTIQSLLQHLTKECVYLIEPLVSPLFVIRDAPNFENDSLFSITVGHFVRLVGVKKLLAVYPLLVQTGDSVEISNGWLLPILRDNISHSELSYFVSHIVPITATLRSRAETMKQENNTLDQKICSNLEFQLWNLLPSFCKNPTDVMESFKVVAKTLGTLLGQRMKIRNVLCSALISLIETCLTDNEKIEVGRFAKNFLPILLNIFLAEPKVGDPPVKPVLDCITAYISVCPKETLHTFFSKILQKTGEEVSKGGDTSRLLEVLEVMIAHLTIDDISTTYSTILPWLNEPGDSSKQKRAYQILCSILEGNADSHSRYVSANLESICSHLTDSLALAQPAAKKHRLKCLLALVKRLDLETLEFIPTILPEVILCVKEQNEKSRVAAYQCLVSIGYVYLDKSEDKRLAMKMYIEMIAAGLTGTTQLSSATLLCLSKLIYEYGSYLEDDVLDQVLEIVVAMMATKQREIIKGVLSFTKSAIGVIPYLVMEPYIKPILESFATMDKPIRHHFRAKIKVLLERMLRRFGYEFVHKLAGPEHKKVLNNIVKAQRRAKSAHSKAGDDGSGEDEGLESDGDDERMEDFKQLRGKGSRSELTSKLVEGEKPLDFLDNSMIPRIYKETKKDPCVLPEKDGKLLIEDLSQKVKDAHISDGEEGDSEEGDEDEIVKAATNPFGRPSKGIYRDTKRKSAAKADGSSYKSSKAAGDMKKKGKQEPFAYISINQKKGKKKAHGQFDNLVKAGKAGALKGRKAKKRQKS